MKLKYYLFFVILLLGFISCKRSPSLILKKVYGIEIKKYHLVEFSDKWAMSDGETKIIMKIDSLSIKDHKILEKMGAQPLPLNMIFYPKFLASYLSSTNGIYIIKGNPANFNYSILIYDNDSKKLVYYCIEI